MPRASPTHGLGHNYHYPGTLVVPGARATTVTVIVGAQFGDEAKGKITDYLAAHARYVVRTGGGPNAGHSIHLPHASLVLHQLACGVLRAGVTGVSGPGMVINPTQLNDEIQDLERRGLLKGEVAVSERAHVVLPLHPIEDAWEEALRNRVAPAASVGTTMRGIGPAYEDRYGRWGVRMADLSRPALLRSRIDLLYEAKAHLSGLPDKQQLLASLTEIGAVLAPYVRSTEPMLWEAAERGDGILLEGAQSALLDIDFGTYPYVTSSHPTAAGALVGSGLAPQYLDEVVGVAKAYCTRVGAGPFPTEAADEMAKLLQERGGERGATTGRTRQCGWLDMVLLRYVARLNGFTSLAITKVDVLGGFDRVPVCTHYTTASGEKLINYPPSVAEEFAEVTAHYREFPGWPEFTPRLKERLRREGVSALPPALKEFLRFITRETGVPVEYVGYGAQRDDTIWMGRGAPAHTGVSSWAG